MAISTLGSRQASAPSLARTNYDDAFSKSAASKQLDLDSYLNEQQQIKSSAQEYLANQNILQQNNAKISAVLQNNPQILQSIQNAPESVKSAFVKSSKGKGTVESTAVLGSYIDAVYQESQRAAARNAAQLAAGAEMAKINKTQAESLKIGQEALKLQTEVNDLKAQRVLDEAESKQQIRLNDASIAKTEAEIAEIEANIAALNLTSKLEEAYNKAVSEAAYRKSQGETMSIPEFTMRYRQEGGLIDDKFIKNYDSLVEMGLLSAEGTKEFEEKITEANEENKQKIKKSFSDMTTLMASADKVLQNLSGVPEYVDITTGMFSDVIGGRKAQARDSQFNTIKAIFGLGNLMRMREANANGAAVGQVSNFEQALFQAISANIGSEKSLNLTGKDNIKKVMSEVKYLSGRIFLTEYYRTVARDGEEYAKKTLGIGKRQIENISKEIDAIEKDVMKNKRDDVGYKQIVNLIDFGGSWREMSNNLAGEEIVTPSAPSKPEPTPDNKNNGESPQEKSGFGVGKFTVSPVVSIL